MGADTPRGRGEINEKAPMEFQAWHFKGHIRWLVASYSREPILGEVFAT